MSSTCAVCVDEPPGAMPLSHTGHVCTHPAQAVSALFVLPVAFVAVLVDSGRALLLGLCATEYGLKQGFGLQGWAVFTVSSSSRAKCGGSCRC